MTLKDWLQLDGQTADFPKPEDGPVSIFSRPGSPLHSLLWKLDDFDVLNSWGAPVIWLIPR